MLHCARRISTFNHNKRFFKLFHRDCDYSVTISYKHPAHEYLIAFASPKTQYHTIYIQRLRYKSLTEVNQLYHKMSDGFCFTCGNINKCQVTN